jgi:cyclic pyranopterin phosphate synthase
MSERLSHLDERGRARMVDVGTKAVTGILAAKRTADWIPLAHPLPLDAVEVQLLPDPAGPSVRIETRVRAHARTGVEMEALVAAAAAGLTLYDMCKAIDRDMRLDAVRLVQKSGGKSGTWLRSGEAGLSADGPNG